MDANRDTDTTFCPTCGAYWACEHEPAAPVDGFDEATATPVRSVPDGDWFLLQSGEMIIPLDRLPRPHPLQS